MLVKLRVILGSVETARRLMGTTMPGAAAKAFVALVDALQRHLQDFVDFQKELDDEKEEREAKIKARIEQEVSVSDELLFPSNYIDQISITPQDLLTLQPFVRGA